MAECKVGGHTRTFLIISAKVSVVCIIHPKRAQVREVRTQTQSCICMSINVRWLMRRHAGKGPARPFGSHKDTCCITIGRIRKTQSWRAESKAFPSEQRWHLRCRWCCVRTFCTASEAMCYVKPPAYCANSHKLGVLTVWALKKTEVVSFAMHTREIFDKSEFKAHAD